MSFVDWFMASLMYCFPYSYRSSNYCDINSCCSFTPLKVLAKSNGNLFAIVFKSKNYCYCDSWKSNIYPTRQYPSQKLQDRKLSAQSMTLAHLFLLLGSWKRLLCQYLVKYLHGVLKKKTKVIFYIFITLTQVYVISLFCFNP